jgi:hypothetical protein
LKASCFGESLEVFVPGHQADLVVEAGLGDQSIPESRFAALSENLGPQAPGPLPKAVQDLKQRYFRKRPSDLVVQLGITQEFGEQH